MKALADLFSTDCGLMGLAGTALAVTGTIGFTVEVRRKTNEEPGQLGKSGAHPAGGQMA